MPIRVLDAATVGRIAAGEVVERPSSVVKELMENSIDAGATAITVETRGGGIEYLRVTDNGCGIEPGQVRLAFENHATSKLQTADQLDDIRTLGFRGEALPSIAAVAHIEMTTRARNLDSGVKLTVDGGKDLTVKEAGCPEGTTIVMRDLFFNVPVRRAFLKKPQYEGSLVSDAVARILLGNPKISVRYISNGQTQFHSFGDGQLRHAVFAVYGKQAAEQMHEVDAFEGGMRISGLIGVGEQARATRAHELFFINGRAVRCAILSKALEEICRSRVTIGLYPMCVLNVTLPASSVDVNVHPNKLEVRFRDEVQMRLTAEKLMAAAFEGEKVLDLSENARKPKEQTLSTKITEVAPAPKPEPVNPEPVKQEPVKHEPVKAEPVTQAPVRQEPIKVEKPKPKPAPVQLDTFQKLVDEELSKLGGVSATQLREPAAAATPYLPQRPVPAPVPPMPERKPAEPAFTPIPDDKPYRIIGVVLKTYILIEARDSLLLIDQHAAHERLQYEKLRARLESGTASQPLLVPVVLKLAAREMALIQDNMQVLTDAGYEVEPFGEYDIQIRAVPFILGKADLKPVFMETINALVKTRNATLDARRDEIMQMACKSAVKAGDKLSDSEIHALVTQLLETGAPPTCPHGRPIMKELSRRDLEKMFKRIQ